MNMDKKIAELRTKIDSIDYELLLSLQKRFAVVRELGAYKTSQELPLEDPCRENKIIKERATILQRLGTDDHSFVRELFTLIFRKSKQIQQLQKEPSDKNGNLSLGHTQSAGEIS